MEPDRVSGYTQHNRRAWNEIAHVRAKMFPPPEFFAQGGSTLDERAVAAVRAAFGYIADLRVLHLQCATGEDTLSWGVLDARAVGVDIADEQIALANQKAVAAGLADNVRFFAADIYDLPDALTADASTVDLSTSGQEDFDLVFTGGGAIVWLPDLRRWAEIVAALLHPGGRLALIDEHPLAGCLWIENGQLVISGDYFSRSNPELVSGWYHFSGGEDAREIKYEFNWPLGDIVNALASAGLIIERLEEYPRGPEWLPEAMREQFQKLPGEFLLLARKPGA